MPAKKTPEQLARVGRSPGRDAGGRIIGSQAGTVACPQAARKLDRAKRILDADLFGIYLEAVQRIEQQTPHTDGFHGVPDPDALEDIAIVERAINSVVPPELELHASDLYSLISRSASYCE
ncbi:MAG TPA: hypothetical protein VGI74_19125 [Streptosporangiaceae bacterium]|jgi:hypothetical protein